MVFYAFHIFFCKLYIIILPLKPLQCALLSLEKVHPAQIIKSATQALHISSKESEQAHKGRKIQLNLKHAYKKLSCVVWWCIKDASLCNQLATQIPEYDQRSKIYLHLIYFSQFELDFYCKNPVQTRKKSSSSNSKFQTGECKKSSANRQDVCLLPKSLLRSPAQW